MWFSQPLWTSLNIPMAYFGILFAILSFFRGIFANLAHLIEDFMGKKMTLILLIFIPFIGYIGHSFFSKSLLSFVFMFAFQLAFAVSRPVISDYINQLVESNIRATVLSVQSMSTRIIFSLIGPLFGYSLDILSFKQTFLIFGFVFLSAGVVCLSFLRVHKVI